MPTKTIKRFMPDAEKIRNHKHLRFFGTLLNQSGLWRLNRQAVAGAFFVGLIAAFIPLPFQMVIAAAIAIVLHVNLPISVALVWISNPLTMPPLFYSCYKVGTWIMLLPAQPFEFELSLTWLTHGMATIWQPFLLGCLVVGLFCGTLGYAIIQCLWRYSVSNKWRNRHNTP
ncbi:MAG: DUF2062 domain-containing protein [Mariprofundaceae bacterium]